jgi:hypothetical protein
MIYRSGCPADALPDNRRWRLWGAAFGDEPRGRGELSIILLASGLDIPRDGKTLMFY